MKIIDLSDEHERLFCCCLEDWSPEAEEAGPRRAQWVGRCRPKGLRAKLAVDDRGTVGGMIQYLPVEHSTADGEGLCFIPCVWVHGHEQGRGDFQGRGMGSALLEAAEADARALGAKGMAAWGMWLPFWMKASWFKRHGYRKVDRRGLAVLLWKPFTPDASPPRWPARTDKLPDTVPGKVTVTALVNGWCMAMNLVAERARRAAAELGDKVEYREVDTCDRKAMHDWGLSDALFVDRKMVRTGPPPSYQTIRKIIAKRLAKV